MTATLEPTDRTGAIGEPTTSPRRTRIVTAGVAALLALAVYAVTNLTAWGQATENGVVFVGDETNALADVPYSDWRLPPLHGELTTVAVGLVLAVVIALVRRRWRDAATVTVGVLGSVGFAGAIARVLVKPALVPGAPIWELSSSFPSGHVVVVAAVSSALLVVVPRSWLRWSVPVLLGWTSLVCAAVLALGWHRPADLLGGALIVAAFFLAASAVFVPVTTPVRRGAVRMLPTAIVVVVLAVALAIQPVAWGVPVFAAFAVLTTALTGFVALRWLRSR